MGQFSSKSQGARLFSLSVLSVVCLGLTWIVVLLRLWVRAALVKQVGKDDYFMVAAQVRRHDKANAIPSSKLTVQLCFTGFLTAILRQNASHPSTAKELQEISNVGNQILSYMA